MNVGQTTLSRSFLRADSILAGCQAVKGFDLRCSITCGWLAGLWCGWGANMSMEVLTMGHSAAGDWDVGNPCALQRGESIFLPSSSQNVCRSTAWLVAGGMAFPMVAVYWRSLGFFQTPKGFYALFKVVLGFFCCCW